MHLRFLASLHICCVDKAQDGRSKCTKTNAIKHMPLGFLSQSSFMSRRGFDSKTIGRLIILMHAFIRLISHIVKSSNKTS